MNKQRKSVDVKMTMKQVLLGLAFFLPPSRPESLKEFAACLKAVKGTVTTLAIVTHFIFWFCYLSHKREQPISMLPPRIIQSRLRICTNCKNDM